MVAQTFLETVKISNIMSNKFFFLLGFIAVLAQSCDTNPVQTNGLSQTPKTDSVVNKTIAQTENKTAEVLFPCSDVLPKKGVDYIQKIYSRSMKFDSSQLLFVTRDSALSVYRQKDKDCGLLVKIPIDSTDLYSYRDGSPLYLQDLDGDNQKEVLVSVAVNGNSFKFRVYRLTKDKDKISLKKIKRCEELVNPEYDKTTGMVRTHWYEKGDYELDEYYKISKDDVLEFVKGFERSNGVEKKYTTKAKW